MQEETPPTESASRRARVLKTYKLYIGGKFPRTESGRSYEVSDPNGKFIANVGLSSRKDVRDAVSAARSAQPAWAGLTSYNRGQILYRIAEMLEGRLEEYALEVKQASGVTSAKARQEAQAAVDRLVYYAGWSDKWSAALSSVNPVAAKMHNFTVPEPVGVVGVVTSAQKPLLSLVSLIAPAIVSGNTIVALLPESSPTPGLAFAEVLAVSDLPGGVVNLLSGPLSETLPTLASHIEVDALDLSGVPPAERTQYELLAADSVKRVTASPGSDKEGLQFIEPFIEYKTTWHSNAF